jgi:competence protein ComEA
MKGCTNYTDEAVRWTAQTGKRPASFRIVLILAIGIAAVFAAVVFWPKPSDEGFAVTSATGSSDSATEAAAAAEQAGSSAAVAGEQTEQLKQAEQSKEAAPLVVYLTGAVLNPGVYELEQGDRLSDVVERAGGLADGSAANYVNLAAPLADGQHIHIPTLAEIESGEAARIAAGGATGLAGATEAGATDASGVGVAPGEQKVNINTADNTALESLPGIGVATAQRIIDYREKNGAFASIEDLKNVSGIGEKKYAELADKVCV